MSQPFKASEQYDDMKGWIAIDGHEGAPHRDLSKYAEIPSGYLPVGFKIFRLDPDENGKIPFSVTTVSMNDVGSTMIEIAEYSKTHEEVPVKSFDGEIPLVDFPKLFKRLDIKGIVRALYDANVVEYF